MATSTATARDLTEQERKTLSTLQAAADAAGLAVAMVRAKGGTAEQEQSADEALRLAAAEIVAFLADPAQGHALKTSFSDYPITALPILPAGFKWEFWCNDVCPLAFADGRDFMIAADYPAPQDREFPCSDRFSVHTASDDCPLDLIASSDAWDEVLSALAAYRAARSAG